MPEKKITMITSAPSNVPSEFCRAEGRAISMDLSGAKVSIHALHTCEAPLQSRRSSGRLSKVAKRKMFTHNSPPVMLYSVMRVLMFMRRGRHSGSLNGAATGPARGGARRNRSEVNDRATKRRGPQRDSRQE